MFEGVKFAESEAGFGALARAARLAQALIERACGENGAGTTRRAQESPAPWARNARPGGGGYV